MSAIYPEDTAFVFESSLRGSINDALKYEAYDLGPTDRLPPGLLDLECEWFFGSSPLTSPSSSPPHSRSASPTRPNTSANLALSPPSPAVTNTTRRAQNSQARRNKKRSRQNRKRERQNVRDNCREDPYTVRLAIAEKYILPAEATKTPHDVKDLPIASSGYIAPPDEGGRIYTLKELVDKMGFRLEVWDGRTPRPITDASSRIIAVLAGTPEAADWEAVHRGAVKAIQRAGSRCSFPRKAARHRRGNFPALSRGISYGGGQKQPGNLYHADKNARALSALAADLHISRLAGHANTAFATWAPKLYTHYEVNLETLLKHDPSLRRNWLNSIWAAFAVNFGPKTVCRRHRDFANLPYGWCGITALGEFDPTKGGHLILWNLKLVVEFPPGSTILLPSAIIPHSNVPIGRRETRYSFTQYTAGGLFRWVDQGFQPTSEYMAKLTAEDAEKESQSRDERCKLGLSLFSTLSSLAADQTARNRLI